MKKIVFSMLVVAVMLILMPGCGPSKSLSVGERQHRISDMETETLQRLYQEQPATKDKIKKAAGYGVFSNANVNIIFASAGGGYGIAVDNSTGKRTYMKMALGGIGLGLGIKDYRQVLIFKSKKTLQKFIESGWEFGGHADAAAKASETGVCDFESAVCVSEELPIWSMYSIGVTK